MKSNHIKHIQTTVTHFTLCDYLQVFCLEVKIANTLRLKTSPLNETRGIKLYMENVAHTVLSQSDQHLYNVESKCNNITNK